MRSVSESEKLACQYGSQVLLSHFAALTSDSIVANELQLQTPVRITAVVNYQISCPSMKTAVVHTV